MRSIKWGPHPMGPNLVWPVFLQKDKETPWLQTQIKVMWGHRRRWHPQAREKGVRRKQTCQHSGLGVWASRMGSRSFCCLSHTLWHLSRQPWQANTVYLLRYNYFRLLFLLVVTTNQKGASLMAQQVKNPLAMQETQEMQFGSGGFPAVGNGNPLQYSCLGNPTDREAWWAAICGVTKSQTQLRD